MDIFIIANGLRPAGMRRGQSTRHETEYYLRHSPRPAGTVVAAVAAVAALGGLVGFLPMLLQG
jgi:hypothetical protein